MYLRNWDLELLRLTYSTHTHTHTALSLCLFSDKQDVESHRSSTYDHDDEEPLCQYTNAKILTKHIIQLIWCCVVVLQILLIVPQEASSCYMHAFLASVSWTILTTQAEGNLSSGDYDALLWAARPALQDMRSLKISLPTQIEGQNLNKM